MTVTDKAQSDWRLQMVVSDVSKYTGILSIRGLRNFKLVSRPWLSFRGTPLKLTSFIARCHVLSSSKSVMLLYQTLLE